MKKTITTITLALVMTFGATFANAGIIIGDATTTTTTCTGTKDGIIIGDLLQELWGIIIGDRSSEPCTTATKDGIIIGD